MTRDVPRQTGGDRDRDHRDADLAVVLRPLLPQVRHILILGVGPHLSNPPGRNIFNKELLAPSQLCDISKVKYLTKADIHHICV